MANATEEKALNRAEPAPGHRDEGTALRVAATYGLASALWILGSDWVLGQIVQDKALLVALSAVKGWAFVAVTALLLFAVLRRRERRQIGRAHV